MGFAETETVIPEGRIKAGQERRKRKLKDTSDFVNLLESDLGGVGGGAELEGPTRQRGADARTARSLEEPELVEVLLERWLDEKSKFDNKSK
jgi:hypothetical protein